MRTLLWTTGTLIFAGVVAICVCLPALMALVMAVGCAAVWVSALER